MLHNLRTSVVGALALGACSMAMGQGLLVHAMSGQPVPGGLPGEVFVSFEGASDQSTRTIPRINNGHVVFRATTREGNTQRSPYFAGFAGSPNLLFSLADVPCPAGQTARHDYGNAATRITPDGRVSVLIRYEGPGITDLTDEAFVIADAGGVSVGMREGDAVPGAPGIVFQRGPTRLWYDNPSWSMSTSGRIALAIDTRPEQSQSLAFRSIASTGSAGTSVVATGYGPGHSGTEFNGWTLHEVLTPPLINAGGAVAFRGAFDRGAESELAIGVASLGAPSLILQPGSADPDHPDQTLLVSIRGNIGFNDSGQVAAPVLVRLGSAPIGSALARASVGVTEVLVRSGDPKPGRPGEVFSTTDLDSAQPRLSGSGAVAFADASRRGAWVGHAPGDLRMAFDPLSAAWPAALGEARVNADTLGMNASDQLVAALTFPASPGSMAVAGWDPLRGDMLIACTGQTIELFPGVFRTIRSLDINGVDGVMSGGGQDGRPNALDDAGRVVFTAHFTNNESAVLVASIPAPTSALPLSLGAMLATARRRTRGRGF